MWNDRDLAYLAGLFDGEGTVEARENKRKDRAADWTLRLGIFNTDGNLMRWLVDTFGGTVNVIGKKNRPMARRDVYVWRIPVRKHESLIQALVPHLIVKRSQVELSLHLLQLMGKPGCQTVDPANLEQRRQTVASIREHKWQEKSYA